MSVDLASFSGWFLYVGMSLARPWAHMHMYMTMHLLPVFVKMRSMHAGQASEQAGRQAGKAGRSFS